MPAATAREACDVCAGRIELAGVAPGNVTCSQHFLDSLFPEDAQKSRTPTNCDLCGWPFQRVQVDCANRAMHGRSA